MPKSAVRYTRSRMACQKCRNLKHKCDFAYPSCSRCAKAKVNCLVQDPQTKVVMLREHFLPFTKMSSDSRGNKKKKDDEPERSEIPSDELVQSLRAKIAYYESIMGRKEQNSSLSMSEITMISMIPFRLAHPVMEREIADATVYGNTPNAKTETELAPLPKRELTDFLITNYFRYAWTQHPLIESRVFLNSIVGRVYGLLESSKVTHDGNELSDECLALFETNIPPRDMFLLYISIAIGSAITAESSLGPVVEELNSKTPNDKVSISTIEGYYHTATYFLKRFFESIPNILAELDRSEAQMLSRNLYIRQSLEVHSTQSLLLLCTYGLLKPITPGIWYIINTAMKLCVDLDFHDESTIQKLEHVHDNSRYYKSFHRRLFWCAYCMDRQICSYVNKPFSLGDHEISTQIKETSYEYDLKGSNYDLTIPGFFVRMRKIQSQLQILYRNPEMGNPIMEYGSLSKWTVAQHTHLNEWLLDCLKVENSRNRSLLETYHFSKEYILINYFQLLETLYKPSVQRRQLSPEMLGLLFEISYQLIKIYEVLYETKKINYKYLSVHSIHQAGIGLFYALINSPTLCLKEGVTAKCGEFIDKVLKMTGYLKQFCPPADNVSKILVSMYNSTKEVVNKRKAAAEQRQQKPTEMVISELLSPAPETLKDASVASMPYYNCMSSSFDASDPSSLDFGLSLSPEEHRLFIMNYAAPIPDRRSRKRSVVTAAVKSPIDKKFETASVSSTEQATEQKEQIGEFFKDLMSDMGNGLSVNLHRRIRPPVFQQEQPEQAVQVFPLPSQGFAQQPPPPPGDFHTVFPTQPIPSQPPVPVMMNTPYVTPGQQLYKMPNDPSFTPPSSGYPPIEPVRDSGPVFQPPPPSELEVADIQSIWESLFDQPPNLKGGFL